MGTLSQAAAVSLLDRSGRMAADPAEEAKHKAQLNEQLKEYINEWRKTREKEEDELKKLKEKQAKRKEIRAEQEKKLDQQKKEEEDKLRQEEAERKEKEAEEKRQEMLEAQKEAGGKKSTAAAPNDAHKEMNKTKEQLEEEKKIALSIRIKPLEMEGLDSDELRVKANEIFNIIIQLETDKYDYEQRKLTQELDLKELKERQKAQLRQKALKKGMDPDALVGKYPPM